VAAVRSRAPLCALPRTVRCGAPVSSSCAPPWSECESAFRLLSESLRARCSRAARSAGFSLPLLGARSEWWVVIANRRTYLILPATYAWFSVCHAPQLFCWCLGLGAFDRWRSAACLRHRGTSAPRQSSPFFPRLPRLPRRALLALICAFCLQELREDPRRNQHPFHPKTSGTVVVYVENNNLDEPEAQRRCGGRHSPGMLSHHVSRSFI
jgi:hypothetical protein